MTYGRSNEGFKGSLRSHDYATVIAGDAVSAVSMAKHKNPDLIILDLGLPAGNGYLVMGRLSNIHYPLLPLSLFLLVIQKDTVNEVWSWRQSFFAKPVDKEVLLSTIEKVP